MGRPVKSITAAQRAALQTLSTLVRAETYLGGGVAVAAHLDHRQSLDLDLFTAGPNLLANREATALSVPGVTLVSQAAGTLHLEVHGVPVSLLRYAYPLLHAPGPLAGLPLPVASV